ESCFEQATEFIPERWTTRPEMVIDKRGYSPFSMGKLSPRLVYLLPDTFQAATLVLVKV
ncbi:hypothetical protein DL98DRAFT_430569, partial [Cadophora sp. DSE1049]